MRRPGSALALLLLFSKIFIFLQVKMETATGVAAVLAAAALPSNPYAAGSRSSLGDQATAAAGGGSVVSPPVQQQQQQQQQQERQSQQQRQAPPSKMPITGPAIVSRLLADEVGNNDGTREDSTSAELAVRINCEWSSSPGCERLCTDILATHNSGGGGGGGAGAAALRDAVQIVIGGDHTAQGGGGNPATRTATDRTTASIRLVQLAAALFDAVQAAKRSPLGSSSSSSGSGGGSNSNNPGGGGGAGKNAATAAYAPKLAATELTRACTATMTALAKSIGAGAGGGGCTWSVPAAQFAMELSYRALHPIVESRSQFLPLWRGITDVALACGAVVSSSAAAASSSSSTSAAADADRRYHAALSDATATLLGYVKEGTDALWTHLSPALLSPLPAVGQQRSPSASVEALGSNPDLPSQLRHLVKMFVFLLARIAHVTSIWSTHTAGGGSQQQQQQQLPSPAVLSSVMYQLARLRGISARMELIAERAQRGGDERTLAILDRIRKDVLEPIAKLGGKADALVVKNLLPSSSSSSSSQGEQDGEGRGTAAAAGGIATTARPTIHRAGLNALLGVADQPSSSDGNDSSTTPTSLALGKLFLLRSLLRKLRSLLVPSEDGGRTDSAAASREANMEATLSISEDLLFFILPLCHSCLDSIDPNDSYGPSILLDVVDLVAGCTLRSELRGNGSNAPPASTASHLRPQDGSIALPSFANQTHMLLARWLVPSKNDCAGRGGMYLSLHPLSRELIVSVVYLHTLRLCAMASEVGRGPSNQCVSSNFEASSRHLISLLCQVLFDPRTVPEGRSNISAVLLRFLSSSSDDAATFVRNETMRSFTDVINERGGSSRSGEASGSVQQRRKAGRKRRRKEIEGVSDDGLFHLARHWSAQDVAAVGPVLSAVSAQGIFWETASDAVKTSIQKLCQNLSASKARRRPGSVGLVAHCLAGGLAHGSGSIVGIDVNNFHTKAIQVLSEISKGSDNEVKAVVPDLLCFVENYMKLRKQTYPASELGSLVQSCSSLVDSSTSGRGGLQACYPVHLAHAVASLLSVLGSCIAPNCPPPLLTTIKSTFQVLFQSNEWPLIAETMASLEEFVTTIPEEHCSIVPLCYPQHLQEMLGCRMQGKIFDLQSMESLNSEHIQLLVGATAHTLSRARRRNVYARSDLSIGVNSTAVTVTRNGKVEAMLVIPQGSSFSMGDLSFNGGFVVNQLGTITHAITARDGSSCALQVEDDTI